MNNPYLNTQQSVKDRRVGQDNSPGAGVGERASRAHLRWSCGWLSAKEVCAGRNYYPKDALENLLRLKMASKEVIDPSFVLGLLLPQPRRSYNG
ncbi:hypothetical protein JCM21142_41508 [Saccharicrinis fermentans DSM 9555 = JCM 21142]|uniref:Uncharacterized protein n=1 Tax=Saccharicrinis fermentans DSM 9555 = JCM 21142 TaxID=869213 RepID=W7YEJ2_9BACT|nr:hypothetical protein JCM21142_41508 [Saccharicrinis fermentans DSM 9555 = JCM 21142]